MKTLRYLFPALALVLTACLENKEWTPSEAPERNGTVIVNSPEGADAGELIIKFDPGMTDMLDCAASAAASARQPMTRSGVGEVDAVLDRIGAYRFKRVFPQNDREKLSRDTGLHLWYVVHFDESTDIVGAAEELSEIGRVSKIQYSRELKRREIKRPVPMSDTPAGAPASRAAQPFNDPQLPEQWHYINTGDQTLIPGSKAGSDVNCAEAWKKCTGDPSIIVAVMDEGVMWAHPDLADNIWINEKEIYKSEQDNDGNGYAGDVYGFNFTANTGTITWTDPSDTGHGTHVAGTIAAVNDNGLGVCGIAGGSGRKDGVKIMSLQIFAGPYGVSPYNEARAIKYAADNGAVILQCSWGYNSYLSDPVTSLRGYRNDKEWIRSCALEFEAFDYFLHNAGSPNGVIDGGIVVFAAGNEYAAAAGFPGAYKDFVCVSAVGADYTPASYTNYAEFVDIAAPGGDIDYHRTEKGSVLSTLPPTASDGIGYGYMDGTSMACPHVSGVAALGLSHAARLHKHFTAAQYRELLLASVRDLDSHLTGAKTYYLGWSAVGEASPKRMDLEKSYRGRMGAGLIDANALLSNIENPGSGVKLEVPNIYVNVDASQTLSPGRFFDGGESLTFTAQSADESVASVSADGTSVTVTGHKTGSTTYTVTASDGTSQTAWITVRKRANDNGWF